MQRFGSDRACADLNVTEHVQSSEFGVPNSLPSSSKASSAPLAVLSFSTLLNTASIVNWSRGTLPWHSTPGNKQRFQLEWIWDPYQASSSFPNYGRSRMLCLGFWNVKANLVLLHLFFFPGRLLFIYKHLFSADSGEKRGRERGRERDRGRLTKREKEGTS